MFSVHVLYRVRKKSFILLRGIRLSEMIFFSFCFVVVVIVWVVPVVRVAVVVVGWFSSHSFPFLHPSRFPTEGCISPGKENFHFRFPPIHLDFPSKRDMLRSLNPSIWIEKVLEWISLWFHLPQPYQGIVISPIAFPFQCLPWLSSPVVCLLTLDWSWRYDSKYQ